MLASYQASLSRKAHNASLHGTAANDWRENWLWCFPFPTGLVPGCLFWFFLSKDIPGVSCFLTDFQNGYQGRWNSHCGVFEGIYLLAFFQFHCPAVFLIAYHNSFIALLKMVPECWVILVVPNQEQCGVSGLVGLTWKKFRWLLLALAQVQELYYMFWHFLKLHVLSGLVH